MTDRIGSGWNVSESSGAVERFFCLQVIGNPVDTPTDKAAAALA